MRSFQISNLKLLLLSVVFFLAPRAYCPQQPQAQAGQPLYSINAKYVNGMAPGYWATKGSGLTLNLSAGTVNCGGIVTYAGGTLTMTASTTNYIFLNTFSSCVPAVNTTGFGSNIPIAVVVAGSSSITSVTDDRTMFQVVTGSGTQIAYNVMAYAAHGDCATSDATAFAAAYSAASAGAPGIVYAPPPPGGCYYVPSTALTVTSPNIGLMGAVGGAYFSGGSMIQTGSATAYIVDVENGGQGFWSQGVSFAPATGVTQTAGGGIKINVSTAFSNGMANISIRGNSFYHLYDAAWLGNNVNGVTLEENEISSSRHDGWNVNSALNVRSLHNDIFNNDGAITSMVSHRWTGCQGCTIDGDQYWGSLNGLVIDGVGTNSIVVNSVMDWLTGDGVVINPTAAARLLTFSNNWISAYSSTSPYGGCGIDVLGTGGGNIDGITVTNNLIRSSFSHGVCLSAGQNFTFADDTFSANGHDNSGVHYGIYIASGVSFGSAHDLTCGATGTDDLDVGSQAGCVYMAGGGSMGWHFHDFTLTGGPGSGITGNQALVFGSIPTGVNAFNFETMGGNRSNNFGSLNASGVQIASGTISALGTHNINLASVGYLPTPNVGGYGWWTRARFAIQLGASGSDSAAICDALHTANGVVVTCPLNVGNVGSGYLSNVSGSTITLTNSSGSVSVNYSVVQLAAGSFL